MIWERGSGITAVAKDFHKVYQKTLRWRLEDLYLKAEPIDMRSGFDRLLYLVRARMKGQINQCHVYLFSVNFQKC